MDKLGNIKVYRGNPLIMGATVMGDNVNFAITAKYGSKCEVILYRKGEDREAFRIPFENAQVIGSVYAMCVTGLDYKKYDYNFCVNDEIIVDKYAKALSGKKQWGEKSKNLRAGIVSNEYDWQDDAPLNIPFDETILYRLHVRGFTKHVSSKVKHKGTYLGIVDKIPYFKELGITMIELMPAYDFNEIKSRPATSMKGQFSIEEPKLNYWGYTDGFIFAPKAAYAYSNAIGGEVEEFKYMVRELHKNGIEISMEFFFPEQTNPKEILDCLHYWVMEYHIDGIHVNLESAVMRMVQTDNLLCTTKIFTYSFATDTDFYNSATEVRNLANFNDDFMIATRRFIKGDEDLLSTIAYKVKANPPAVAIVNYVALLGWCPEGNQEIFSLEELVKEFDYHNMSKSPAVFDIQKLKWMNGEYLKAMDFDKFFERAEKYIKEVVTKDYDLKKIAALVKTRIEIFPDIKEQIDFFEELPEYDTAMYCHKKMKTNEEKALEVLKEIYPLLEKQDDFSNDALFEALKSYVDEKGFKTGYVMWPIRTAVSGKQSTPGGATEIMEILGKEESLKRIQKGIELLER